MSMLRWRLGALVALLALWAAVQAVWTYLSHGLWLGTSSVITLLLMDVTGMWSLWRARERLRVEWQGLTEQPLRGSLVTTRTAVLQRLHDAHAQPNLDALANATAAQERGEAYLGRYMAAVTVLVGLVGTFAGLMETLGKVTPLLSQDTHGVLEMIAAPLSGLDVTLGASVVGILVTLALTMVQGDVTLAQEAVLARLEEVTAHDLIPALWKGEDTPAAVTARETTALRAEMATLTQRMAAESAQAVAAVANGALERQLAMMERVAGGALKEAALQVKDSMLLAVTRVEEELRRSLTQQTGAWTTALESSAHAADKTQQTVGATAAQMLEQVSSLSQVMLTHWESVSRTHAQATQDAQGALATAATTWQAALEKDGLVMATARAQEQAAWRAWAQDAMTLSAQAQDQQAAQLGTLVRQTVETLGNQVEHSSSSIANAAVELNSASAAAVTQWERSAQSMAAVQERVGADAVRSLEMLTSHTECAGAAVEQALQKVLLSHEQTLLEAASRVANKVGEVILGAGVALDAAAARLTESVFQLSAGSQALVPAVQTLTPELAALSREVALMASRQEESESQNLMLEEITRVGEGMERLQALLQVAQESRA